jgi:putative MATE family efflux protein
VAAIGIFLAEQILILFGVEPDVVSEGAAYLRINFVGMVTMTFRMMTEATMNASGDTMRPMRIAVVFRAFHVALAPFLVFGWWIFPRLGVSGAAITNVFSQAIGAGLGFWLLFTGGTRLRLTMKNYRFDPGTMWRMVKIGIPASITNMERTFGQLLLMWFVVPFGTLAVAAHTVGQRIDNFVHNPSMAFGQASGVLGGQNLGASQPARAERTAWIAGAIVTGILVSVSVPMFIWAEGVAAVFTPKPDLQELTGTFIRIVAVGNLFFGLVIVLSQTLNGVGDTLPVMVVTLIGMWVVQVPTAFLLTRFVPSLGVHGVWWAIVSGVFARAVIYTLYFRRGSWKTRSV